ncbi:MAG: phenylalanine--tRNA ligase subunit alpha [Candidatus Saccharimonadales bacterium]
MTYQNKTIEKTANTLLSRLKELENKKDILKSIELKALFEQLKTLPQDQKAIFGEEVNELRDQLVRLANDDQTELLEVSGIDITAPYDPNTTFANRPKLLSSQTGSMHPLMVELDNVLDIFYRMGFTAIESREIDDDFHMFGSLNFPDGHPARDEFDTFVTIQKDKDNNPYIAPAHTSIMQNRILRKHAKQLSLGQPIAAVIPGRVFRNEDLDARHEHTFYQFEGVYVDKDVTAGNLMATFKTFLSEYYGQTIEIKSQPFYFPFTEPSFELSLSCPFCHKKGCHICSQSGWIELLGMGMIHPNVLSQAGIDPNLYTGCAWGCGLDRLVMMKYDIEDIRHFESGKLDFLRQFS